MVLHRSPKDTQVARRLKPEEPRYNARRGASLDHTLHLPRKLGSIRAAWVAHPVARTRAKTRGSISWVRELALVQRQTAATDASREPCSEPLKLRDALVNPAGPTA